MKPRHTLTDPEQVKALATPLRRRILEVLGLQPMTTKQAAERLGEPPTRLYHHVAALEAAGLIEQVEERRKRGTVERYYQPIAQEFVVDPRLFAAGATDASARGVQDLFVNALEETLQEVQQGIGARLQQAGASSHAAMLGRMHVRGSQEQIQAILERLQALMQELRPAECAEGDVEYGLTVVYYPVAATAAGERKEQENGDGG